MNSLLLQNVLSQFPAEYRPANTDHLRGAAGFSGAEIVQVETLAGKFCLRGWPSGGLPKSRILGLHRLLYHCKSVGFSQIAVPFSTIDGTTLVEVESQLWQLEPWLPGTADFHANGNDERLKNAMHALAEWHLAACQFMPRAEEQAWFDSSRAGLSPAVRERAARIEKWLAGRLSKVHSAIQMVEDEFSEFAERVLELFSRCAKPVLNELQALEGTPFCLQPCLRDIWHDHVLFTGDEVTGLIDPSACRSENIASDLARLLGSFFADDLEGWSRGISYYGERHELSLDELGLVTVLDRSSVLLAGMTWIERRFFQGENFGDDKRILDRMRVIVARLERLASPDASRFMTW